MIGYYVDDFQQDWDAYASALLHTYNSQVHRLTNTRPFDVALSHRILNITLESIVDTEKCLPLANTELDS